MPTLDLIAELIGHTERVWQAVWHPSGSWIATCSSDKSVRLWRQDGTHGVSTWCCFRVLEATHQRTIRSVAFSPCGRYLACASFDGTTSVYVERKPTSAPLPTGDALFSEVASTVLTPPNYRLVATLEGHENEVKSVAWNANGSLLATCGRDKSVWIWALEEDHEFECLAVLQEHTQDVKRVVWHPREDILVSCSYDDSLRVWQENGDDWVCTQTLKEHTSTVWCMAFDPSGRWLVSCGDDKRVSVWTRMACDTPVAAWRRPDDAAVPPCHTEWQCHTSLTGPHERSIYSVDWSTPCPTLIASGGGDNAICVYSIEIDDDADATTHTLPTSDRRPRLSLTLRWPNAHAADVNSVQWHPSLPGLLVSAADDDVVRLWRYVE